MKIRNGFVSNSSSSSFILYGVKIKTPKSETKHEALIDMLDESDLSYEEEDGHIYIGKHLADIDDGITKIALTDAESVKIVDMIIDLCEKADVKPKETDFAIYAGTAYN
jgi:hypothetical protein